MKKQNKKRGFTIIELVIVVAVIAILSAVLIPTFSGIIKKSRQSADETAVRNMNTSLQAYDLDEFDSITDVVAALYEDGWDAKDYKPLSKDTYFFWVKSENRIVIANANNEVVYPAQYAELTKTVGDWWTLSGEIAENDNWKNTIKEDTTVEIANANQLVSFMKAYSESDKYNSKVTEIKLTADVDMMGATQNFAFTKDMEGKDIVFDGNGKTIYGFRADENTYAAMSSVEASVYGYGLFAYVPKNTDITVKNLTVDGAIVGDTNSSSATGSAGVIAGNVKGKLTVDNVTITNSVVFASKKVGAVVGYVGEDGSASKATCAITLNKVTVTNTVVKVGREGAAVIGYVHTENVGATSFTNVTFTNVTVEADASYGYSYNADKTATTTGQSGITQKAYWKSDKVAYDFQ